MPPNSDLLLVEDTVWVLTAPVGLSIYDFNFDLFLNCRRPWQRPRLVEAVARIGAVDDYLGTFGSLLRDGVRLIHTPEEHERCSLLPHWYPLLEGLTPKSLWFHGLPDVKQIESELGWPIFTKGVRQTSGHRRKLSIIDGPESMKRALAAYAEDPVLRWQDIACRKFVPLRPVAFDTGDKLPASFEFRTWWCRGKLAGLGRYWWEGPHYSMTEAESGEALSLAEEVARRINVRFLVVDVAQTATGEWIVIECNDAQEGGYPGIAPVVLWRKILEIERAFMAG